MFFFFFTVIFEGGAQQYNLGPSWKQNHNYTGSVMQRERLNTMVEKRLYILISWSPEHVFVKL